MPLVTIDTVLLASLVAMSTSHVEDIESGLEDGTYQFNGNEDFSEKRKAVNLASALLSAGTQRAVQPTQVAPSSPEVRRYGCFNRKPLVDKYVIQDKLLANGERDTITVDNVMTKDCQYSLHSNDPRCNGCAENQKPDTVTSS